MGTFVPINQSRPPSKLRARKGSTSISNFTEGVADSFPRLSVRGKAFWIRVNGKEYRAGTVHPEKGAIVDLVLVNAGRQLAKTYYSKPFTGAGDAEMPDCWSLDSIRPDPAIVKPVNPTCPDCPKNAFNSAPSGRGGKACADSKRVVVTTADQLLHQDPTLLLMRMPQQSLKNMKNHVELLAKHGYVEPYSCVTRLSFDLDVEFPKVQFEFVEPLTDEEFDAAEELASSKKVNDMLKNPDFDNAASDQNALHANDDEGTTAPLRHQRRQPQPGFPVGGGEQEEAAAQPQAAKAENVSRETWEDLGDGTELNIETGEVREQAKAKPIIGLESDPDVLQTSDGRFFNRTLRKFVDSPYRDAKPAPEKVEAEAPVKKTRRPRTKKAEPEPETVEATAEKAEEPENHSEGNGVEAPRGKVVAATPKLEALLGSLVPNDDEK